ncbi:MAG: hypothetical protein PHE73_05155 [Sulfurovaceae bacterium]|nr:hypothetical protein [Sulfurovaceae bacterium]
MLNKLLKDELPLLFVWLIIGLISGIVYAFARAGIIVPQVLLTPVVARSLHISQMLYGFFPLVLSLLPFAIFEKDGVLSSNAVLNLRRYFVLWNMFLLFMTMSLLFGNQRGLPFYDFPYTLNFLLAFSGFFYILALIDAVKAYEKLPLWVIVSLAVVVIAPILLVVLMNPDFGQVEKTLVGPHGDNTLGMSFALIPIYYLIIKLVSPNSFKPRYAWLWILPFVGYIISLIIRNFFHSLSYNEEWFFQYLTLFYLPLLLIWLRDSGLKWHHNPYLVLSIAAFLFVDLEGNILFIPQIRTLIHRNDLVVGHAHIAMGIGVAFMALSIASYLLPSIFRRIYAFWYFLTMLLMAFALTLAGLVEGGFISGNIEFFMIVRVIFGIIVFMLILHMILNTFVLDMRSKMQLYHIAGFISDALGGIILIIAGGFIFSFLGWKFDHAYIYVIFAFMIGTGIIHLFGYIYNSSLLGMISALVRLLVSSMFISLYMAHMLDGLALAVGLYDGLFALIYLLYLRDIK